MLRPSGICSRIELLAFLKREWKRVREHLRSNGVLPWLVLQETEINLSAGGIGFTVDARNRPTPLSMLFFALDEGLSICVLAETIWEQTVDEGLRCGSLYSYPQG
ncbi:MAG: hypothetical protein WCD00_03055 [Desulfuromonadaceae bacterium]